MISRITKLVISILFHAIHKVIHVICSLLGRQISPTLVILTYHPVKTSETARFERQMNMLLNTGKPISLSHNISTLGSGYNIAVTFDDAYQSILKNALPVLRAKNIPATIFVPTGYLGKKPIWIKNPNHKYANETVLTEEQLKALPTDLITVGSHTVSHINLNREDKTTIRYEITDSKKTLERILDREVTLFAAPYATLNEKYAELFKEAGYQHIFLNIPTFPFTKLDQYILGRISVEPTDWPIEYYLKLLGAYQWLPFAISLKKKLLGCIGF
jgi:peptidoglycan/xylan/chitin deacetylase (PgdA/CDA1 family)